MKIYDISQEIFSCAVFTGDPAPERKILNSMKDGGLYNLTEFSMCAHNGTHIDAPFHFIDDGKRIDEIPLEKFIGFAYVFSHDGILTAADAKSALEKAAACDPECAKRILMKGTATVSEEAAEVFADAGIFLFGNESQTVGPEDAPMKTHLILLGAGVVLLEGIRLGGVEDGKYLLSAAPISLGGADGAPCRAVLIQ